MEHPFIKDLSGLSIEELQEKISDLHKKINFAYRISNGPMIHQLNMIIESYKSAYNKKMDDLMKKQNIHAQVSITKDK